GALDAERADQGRDVVGHGLEPHRPVGRGRAPVGLEVDPDDLAAAGEQLQVGPEHLHGAEAPMQEDQRPALAEGLVAELDAVDLDHAGRRDGASHQRFSKRWLIQSTIPWRGAPGVKISATPRFLSSSMSSSGMMPPPNTTMSPAPFSLSTSITRGNSVMCAPAWMERPIT